MCKSDGRLVDHPIIHCPVAWYLWTLVISWFDKEWAFPGRVMELLHSCRGTKVRKRRNCWHLKEFFRAYEQVLSLMYNWESKDRPFWKLVDFFRTWVTLC